MFLGTGTEPNKLGVQYYKNLLKELRDNNIEPFVTIYHWDMPLALEKLGGYYTDKFADWYADYARTCFREFGDSVKYWATFNEPQWFCGNRNNMSAIKDYQCARNVLRAHAKAYRIYEKEFKPTQKGNFS